ncbi:MalY/PatB family protein [Clostridium algidicarnis]|uniref:MalY/PatB family protein n=1 Tax=Clostridium algidicarnis TaxID=37659 RepID=UPI000495E5EA|nr:MalY/PatB family protein [Clostridium algidicarnis]
MNSLFDEIINRRGTNCGRWDTMDTLYKDPEIIHMGVADMDFKSPPAIIKGFKEIIDQGVFGYTDLSEGLFNSIQRWYIKQYEIEIPKEWIVFCPRINISSSLCVSIFSNEGDDVIINTPAYGPLQNSITKNNRNKVFSNLKLEDDLYVIDWPDMNKKVSNKTKMMILCNPHNPTGRVWNKKELVEISDFCIEKDILLYCDEIHGDITANGIKHTTMINLSDELNERLIVAGSMTKTFNIPGVIVSFLIIPNKQLRDKVKEEIDRIGMHNPSIFAVKAVEEAYNNCDEWYEEMKEYIDGNDDLVRRFLSEKFPEFKVMPRQGTYLLWINYSKSGKTSKEIETWFLEKAKVSVYMGDVFGQGGDGFFRFNLASSKLIIQEVLNRMEEAKKFL